MLIRCWNQALPSRLRPKLFGVALDVSDDPFSVHLKEASIWAQFQGQRFPQDPYEVINEQLTETKIEIDRLGRFPLASWLGPRPSPSDQALLTQEQARKFLNGDGPFKTACELREFVLTRILPGIPIMVGIDHSASGGVVSALSQVLGPERLTVVVLDRHFDGLPASMRMNAITDDWPITAGTAGGSFFGMPKDVYCCGNFWAHLMRTGVVLPERLVFVGVADYPHKRSRPNGRLSVMLTLISRRRAAVFSACGNLKDRIEKALNVS